MATLAVASATSEIAAPPSALTTKRWEDAEGEKVGLLCAATPTAASAQGVAPLQFGVPDAAAATEAPQVEQMTKRPANLQPVPASYELWPSGPIFIACPTCGVYASTTLEAETGAPGRRVGR